MPFFVCDLSLKDVVVTRSSDNDPELLSFERVLKKSGHRTIRARPNQFASTDEKGLTL